MSTQISPKKMTITNDQQKPFQCAICEKTFRQLSTLTNHFKIHTGEKVISRGMCEYEFLEFIVFHIPAI